MQQFPADAVWLMNAASIQMRALLALGRPAEATQVAERVLGSFPMLGGSGVTEVEVRLAASEAFHHAGDFDRARTELGETLRQIQLRADDITDPFGKQLPHPQLLLRPRAGPGSGWGSTGNARAACCRLDPPPVGRRPVAEFLTGRSPRETIGADAIWRKEAGSANLAGERGAAGRLFVRDRHRVFFARPRPLTSPRPHALRREPSIFGRRSGLQPRRRPRPCAIWASRACTCACSTSTGDPSLQAAQPVAPA